MYKPAKINLSIEEIKKLMTGGRVKITKPVHMSGGSRFVT